jgi:hypothetical protein
MNRTWVYARDGRVFEKGSPEWEAYLNERRSGAPMIAKEEPPFISPIDGKLVSGRAQLREHNRRHDVVNWRDCKGLPQEMPKVQPEGIKAAIIESAKRKGYL